MKAQVSGGRLGSGIHNGRHIEIFIWFFQMALNGKEPSFNFLQHGGIIINHAAGKTHFHRRVGNKEIATVMAIQVIYSPFLEPIASAE